MSAHVIVDIEVTDPAGYEHTSNWRLHLSNYLEANTWHAVGRTKPWRATCRQIDW